MIKLAIIGSGGHTRSSINLLLNYFDMKEIGIYDDSYDFNNPEKINSIQVIGNINNIKSTSKVFLSIGNNHIRKKYFSHFKNQLVNETIKHGSAQMEKNVSFGVANQIYANTYINSLVYVGDNNIINSGAIIEHESSIGNHNHISIGTKICGRCNIGNECFIGAGAILIDKLSICDKVTIGAGSVVVEDITEPGTYVGNPARKIKWYLFLHPVLKITI